MEMKDFFDFRSQPANSKVVQAHPTENIDQLKLIKGNYREIYFPITFKQEYGKKLYDVLDTGFAGLFLISERMRKILAENYLTGWKAFPIKLYDKKGNEIIGYHGFSVAGQSGPTSYKNSEIIEKKLVPSGPLCKYYKGLVIDKWDGTDFFTPDGTYETFITRRAADVLKKNKISNIHLENLAETETNVRHVKKDAHEVY